MVECLKLKVEKNKEDIEYLIKNYNSSKALCNIERSVLISKERELQKMAEENISEFNEKIQQLSLKIERTKDCIEFDIKSIREEHEIKVSFHQNRINEFEKILDFLVMKENFYISDFPEIKSLIEIDTFLKDEYSEIRAFITISRRRHPVHTYCLVLLGITSLENLRYIQLPSDYFFKDLCSRFSIRKLVKKMPTKEKLRYFYFKHKHEFLRGFLDQYIELYNEFNRIIGLYSFEDFKSVIETRSELELINIGIPCRR